MSTADTADFGTVLPYKPLRFLRAQPTWDLAEIGRRDGVRTRKSALTENLKAGVVIQTASHNILVGMGIPEYEAKRYEGRVKEGGVLLSVHCNSSEEITRAKDLLKQTGAEDIASAGEAGVSKSDRDVSEPVGRR